ncbi:MAG: recombination protein NinB [Xanthomonadales bacterium]|nr:recombination protein NinB [Xanthomonadales bacterium]
MNRQPFQQRTFRLVGQQQVAGLIGLIGNLPIDAANPLEVVIREEKKARKPDQNSLYWAGPLRDISEQAWVCGSQYSAETWHEHFKREYLPDDLSAGFDGRDVKDGYRKWTTTPSGSVVLIGSTTQLTVRGMAEYLDQVYAYGASMGVQFGARQ